MFLFLSHHYQHRFTLWTAYNNLTFCSIFYPIICLCMIMIGQHMFMPDYDWPIGRVGRGQSLKNIGQVSWVESVIFPPPVCLRQIKEEPIWGKTGVRLYCAERHGRGQPPGRGVGGRCDLGLIRGDWPEGSSYQLGTLLGDSDSADQECKALSRSSCQTNTAWHATPHIQTCPRIPLKINHPPPTRLHS